MNHQPPDWNYKFGFTEIIPNQLYMGGEDDVDDLLYGEEQARQLNGNGTFTTAPTPQIDAWIDLRDLRESNRSVYLPNNIEYYPYPFRDGNVEEAKTVLPRAKERLTVLLKEGKRVLVSCHEGKSRSFLLVMWQLIENGESVFDAYWEVKAKRPIVEHHKNFQVFLDEWKNNFAKERVL